MLSVTKLLPVILDTYNQVDKIHKCHNNVQPGTKYQLLSADSQRHNNKKTQKILEWQNMYTIQIKDFNLIALKIYCIAKLQSIGKEKTRKLVSLPSS